MKGCNADWKHSTSQFLYNKRDIPFRLDEPRVGKVVHGHRQAAAPSVGMACFASVGGTREQRGKLWIARQAADGEDSCFKTSKWTEWKAEAEPGQELPALACCRPLIVNVWSSVRMYSHTSLCWGPPHLKQDSNSNRFHNPMFKVQMLSTVLCDPLQCRSLLTLL